MRTSQAMAFSDIAVYLWAMNTGTWCSLINSVEKLVESNRDNAGRPKLPETNQGLEIISTQV